MDRMIGGQIVPGHGGHLVLNNWFRAGSESTTPANIVWLDVIRFDIQKRIDAPMNWYSGSCGAIRRRAVCTDWTARVSIWFDGNYYEEEGAWRLRTTRGWTRYSNDTIIAQSLPVFKLGSTLAVQFILGNEEWWRSNLNDGATFIPSWKSPQAILTYVGPRVASNEKGSEGIIRQDLQLDGDSLLWFLETEQDEVNYQTYLTKLMAQNEIACEA